MLRLVGFFLACLLVLNVLRGVLGGVPVIGTLLNIPLVGFWIVAIGLSMLLSRVAVDVVDLRRQAALRRSFDATDTPRNRGKLGALLLNQGRARRAIEPLAEAAAGEPEVAEWHYRLGQARLATGDVAGALEALGRAVELDEEHAYGGALMRLAEATLIDGDATRSLELLARVERNHGPSPESAYRRGLAHRAAGQTTDAKAAFAEVREHTEALARYQKKSAGGWLWRARLARLTTS